jgi:type IV pilus assembly protein PilZ
LVTIMDEDKPLQIAGKVVWVSPPGAIGNKPRGIGLQFLGDSAKKTSRLIERKLGASVSLARATHTM